MGTHLFWRRLALVSVFLLTQIGTVDALERRKFDPAAFAAAQNAGHSILVEVHAVWCHICWSQQAVLTELEKSPSFKKVVAFTIDYDSDESALKQLNVQKQSTLIVFKGNNEVGRSVGDTNGKSIEALLARAL